MRGALTECIDDDEGLYSQAVEAMSSNGGDERAAIDAAEAMTDRANRALSGVSGSSLLARVKALEEVAEALRWYADPANWSDSEPGWHICENQCEGECSCDTWETDCGEHARKALTRLDALGKEKTG